MKCHVLNNKAFFSERPDVEGKLGTHSSIRKFTTTTDARQCGGSRDDVDYRVRLKFCWQQG